ncbi:MULTISPECIES: aldose 1-epimerase family protein [unclassified Beijerinckia]|uniref:aldose 1-epimerase family protein n=1 Tax=unclassified Beijerinckia TaxID=2638183 RepID=UPI000894A8FC|nr:MULTISPECIES: aldose 1-epimerase family protein [unclassified Beijerinckia]MDH7794735.1 galactose mutarotase-like enzyme [Beijerinckia sp. GAS462]SEB73148.1 Galactose mutarotase [Beijerinckia sp. 28-YEA-48]
MIELACADARASIALLGGELRAWRVGGQELIWTPDPAIWNASAPVLFPIVGWAREGAIRVGGKRYPIGVHGFAAASLFAIEAQRADEVTLAFRDDARSRAHYPFGFRFSITYRLSPTALGIDIAVANTGDEMMPYACGLHPGFRWPFAGGAQEQYAIRFAEAEVPSVPVIAPGGQFSARRRAIPLSGRDLPLIPGLFAAEALCFLDAASRQVDFIAPDGQRLSVATQGFPHWALWSRPGAPFLSIESWSGHGDPEGFDGELADKPSMILLQPGQTRRHGATYALHPAV